MKKCSKCKLEKRFDQFGKSKTGKFGLDNYCKSCKKDYEKSYKRDKPKRREYLKKLYESPEGRKKHQNRYLKYTYGITLDQYNELLKLQNFGCAICGIHHEVKQLFVDHCHKTNKVRGLLCNFCNTGLGNFQDDPKLLETAIDYLKNKKG